jgi:UDP-glucose 4-epimerase
MKGTVLLTGATGLVGTDLVQTLTAAGHVVHAVSRRPPASTSANWIVADLSGDPDAVLSKLPRVEYVVHAAAALRHEHPQNELSVLRRTNMEFTEELFQWAANGGVHAVIYLSSFSLMRKPLADVIDEQHPIAPLTPYALSKYWGELAIERFAGLATYRPVTLRISSPIAFAYDRLQETVVKKWIRLARQGRALPIHGRGERTQDFVATQDIAQAVVRAIESRAASGIYHIGSGSPISMRDLAELIARTWRVTVQFAGEDFGEHDRWNIAIGKARQELGYAPQYSSRGVIEKLLNSVANGSASDLQFEKQQWM